MTNTQANIQASFRAIGSTTGNFNSDALAAMVAELTAAEITPPTDINGVLLAWLQLRNESEATDINGLIKEFGNTNPGGAFDPFEGGGIYPSGFALTNTFGAPTIEAAASLVPTDFPSAEAWWEASFGSGAGHSAGYWPSNIDELHEWGQRGAGATPTWQTRNTYEVAQFLEASSQSLDTLTLFPELVGNTGLIAVVAELNGNPSSSAIYHSANGILIDSQGADYGVAARTTDSQPLWLFGIYDGAFNEIAINATVSERTVLLMYKDATHLHASVNGGTESSVEAGDPTATGQTVNLGCSFNASVFFNGWIYEIFMAKAIGTSGERASLVAYLKDKYGIS